MSTRQVIFLDRDGVINREQSYVKSPEEFVLLPKVPQAIQRIQKAGFLAVVITNQSAVAQGMFSLETLLTIHNKMNQELAAQGAYLDGIYYCPHHPSVSPCTCRKPQNGMLLQAQKDLQITFNGSWMVGDHGRDIACGQSVGLRTIAIAKPKTWAYPEKPDYFFDGLFEAIDRLTTPGALLPPPKPF